MLWDAYFNCSFSNHKQSSNQSMVLSKILLSSLIKVGHIVACLSTCQPGHASGSSLEQSLGNITSLGLEGNHLCRLMTKHGAVSSLVKILSQVR